MLVDTNSVNFKYKLVNELVKCGIDYDTAVILLGCVKNATEKVIEELDAKQ